MEVLVEQIDDVKNEILEEQTESGQKKKRYIIEGICMQAEVRNRNGRIYPKNLVKPVIDTFIKEEVAKGRAVGHLNHPANDPRNDYREVSHKFESLVESGNDWIGRAVVTQRTPMGQIVAGLMDEGVQMGISSRALGKTKLFESKGQKTRIVQTFQLISPGDIVSDPSAPDAYLTNLMEGKEWVWENGLLVEKEKEIKLMVNEAARTGNLDHDGMIQIFEAIIKKATAPKSKFKVGDQVEVAGDRYNKGFRAIVKSVKLGSKPSEHQYTLKTDAGNTKVLYGHRGMTPWS